jgi:hypothetical protein
MIKSPAFTPLTPEQFEQRKAAQIKALLTRRTAGWARIANRRTQMPNRRTQMANRAERGMRDVCD